MAFKKIGNTRYSAVPRVTVNSSDGRLSFNRCAISIYKIKNYNFGVLYFDKQKNRVGIKLHIENVEDAIKIQKHANGCYLSFINFLTICKINPDSIKKIETGYHKGIIIIPLQHEA